MDNYKIVRLSETNFPQFYRLFVEVFHSDISFENFLKKYSTGYLGDEYQYIGFLALNGKGEAVSYSGGIPFKINLEGIDRIVLHSCDHCTRKDARKKGLFPKLTEATEKLCVRLKIPLLFGIPNQNNHPILVKYHKWIITDTLQVFVIPVVTLPIAAAAQRFSFLKKICDAYQKYHIEKHQSDKNIIQNIPNRIVKDEAFYQFKNHTPNYTLNFKHGRVWLKLTSVMTIGEIELFESNEFEKLIHEIQWFARKVGVHKVLFAGSNNLPITALFKKQYTAINGNGVGGKIFDTSLSIDLFKIQYTTGDYDSF